MRVNVKPVGWLLRLYPPSWRKRYGEEFVALLEQCQPSPMLLFDVALGALDARIAPQDMTGRILKMIDRPRRTAITVFCAYIAFVVAGMGFQKMTEEPNKAGFARAYPAIGISFTVVEVGAAVALLAVVAGGLPIAYAALRYALAARRRDIVLLFAVPPLALALWLGYTALLMNRWIPSQPHMSVNEPLGLGLLLSWVGLFILAAIASAAAVSLAVARSAIDERVVRFALGPAAVATLAMAAMLVAVVVWGLSLRAAAPQAFSVDGPPIVSYKIFSWLRVVIVMAAATIVAAASLFRGIVPRAPAQPS
jgi:hypothetical protein